MLDTVPITTSYPDLVLRLQTPTLTVLSVHAHGEQTATDGAVNWGATAAEVTLTGQCIKVGANLWHLDFSLENAGEDVEARIALPYIFYHFPDDQPVRIFNPAFGGVLDYPVAGYPFRQHYPGQAGTCLTGAFGIDYGFAVGMFNFEQRHVEIRHIPTAHDGQIQFVFERVMVKKCQTVNLPRLYIAAADHWATAFTPYRDWYQAHYSRQQDRPDWLVDERYTETRKAHCVAPFNPPALAEGVWVFDDLGKPRTFEQVKGEIDGAIDEGDRLGYNPLFYQFGWWSSMATIRGLYMFDIVTGDYTDAHDLARQIVDYIHQRGKRTYLYTNSISAGTESRVFAEHPELFVRDTLGHPSANSEYPMFMFCPGAPGMKEYWDKNLQYMLGDLGADGIFLDQVGGGFPAQYCYDPSHGHDHPDTYGADMVELVSYIARRAREIRPDAYIGGELWLDSRSILLDESHGWGYHRIGSKPPATLDEQRRLPPPEEFIFTRFLSPGSFSQKGNSEADMMNGAAGSHAYPLWSRYRHIFESNVEPCRTYPSDTLAYLFGPVDNTALLAIRSHGDVGDVEIYLPEYLQLAGGILSGIRIGGPKTLHVKARTEAEYYVLNATTDQPDRI